MKAQVTRVIAGFYDLWIPRSNEFFIYKNVMEIFVKIKILH